MLKRLIGFSCRGVGLSVSVSAFGVQVRCGRCDFFSKLRDNKSSNLTVTSLAPTSPHHHFTLSCIRDTRTVVRSCTTPTHPPHAARVVLVAEKWITSAAPSPVRASPTKNCRSLQLTSVCRESSSIHLSLRRPPANSTLAEHHHIALRPTNHHRTASPARPETTRTVDRSSPRSCSATSSKSWSKSKRRWRKSRTA